MKRIENRRLSEENLKNIVCCPGGLEVKGKEFKGEIERTVTWREEMLELGMRGFVSYMDGVPRGFIEYMPAETAPFPIEAPSAAVLMCYHWVVTKKSDEEEHLAQEKRLIELVIEEAKGEFTGLATLGWDNPIHFPIAMLEELGFQQLERSGYIALMWLPFQAEASTARMLPSHFTPQDLSAQGLLAIESASSSRCPYSIHNAARLEQTIARITNKERIRHFPHLIDTHADTIKWSISPWDWTWLFLNGEEIAMHELKSDVLKRLITDRLAVL